MIESKIVPDGELDAAFRGTDFGNGDHRQILNASVLKCAVDYHCGWTITQIMVELGLISGRTNAITAKGKHFLREAYDQQMRAGG